MCINFTLLLICYNFLFGGILNRFLFTLCVCVCVWEGHVGCVWGGVGWGACGSGCECLCI